MSSEELKVTLEARDRQIGTVVSLLVAARERLDSLVTLAELSLSQDPGRSL